MTRFDMRAIEGANLWYDRRLMASNHSDAVADMLVKVAGQNQTWEDDHVFASWTHDPVDAWVADGWRPCQHSRAPGQRVRMGRDRRPARHFERHRPDEHGRRHEGRDARRHRQDVSLLLPPFFCSVQRADLYRLLSGLGMSNTFKNDARIVRFCAAEHDTLVSAVSEAMDPSLFSSLIVLQPLAAYMGALGQAAGGKRARAGGYGP